MLQAKDAFYVIVFLLALNINHYRIFAEPFNRIYRNDYLQEVPAENTGNLEDYSVKDNKLSKNQKRDIIKGPSLFSKIDASTADSDLAFENDEVTGHTDFSKYYDKPKYNIEDNLENIDRWSPPAHNFGMSHIHKKKSYVVDERPSKKSTFPKHRHINYDDVPDEVIKALYNWKLDDASEKSTISKVSNSSSDVATDSSKPYLTEDGFSLDEHANAEPVVPVHTLMSLPTMEKKKRRKINVLVNVKIKEEPGRRSGVGNSHRLGNSFITLSSETEMPQKRHFPYFYHQRRRHRIHHGLSAKKTLAEDSVSGEGSGSGTGELITREHQDSDEIKGIAGGDKSEQKVKVNAESEGESENDGSGSGHISANFQQMKLKVTPYVRNESTQTTTNNITNGSQNEDVKNRSVKDGEGTYTTDAQISDHEGSTDQRDEKTSSNTEQRDEKTSSNAERDEKTSSNAEQRDEKTSSNAERDEKTSSNAEQRDNEVHKENSESSDKVNVAPSSSIPQVAAIDEVMSNKEKQGDISNTDGTDNMKKKSGQEDKYETLEEVREKFKKWESNIIQSPSEQTVVDENSNLATKNDGESDNSDTKSEESNDSTARSDENSNLSTKRHENNQAAKQNESNATTEKIVKNNSSQKSDENNLTAKINNNTIAKSYETNNTSTSKKVEESSNAIKATDLATGELITEKEGGEEEAQHVIKEKQPDDFVKELIGIPSKKLILKEKENVQTVTKSSQDNKIEKESEDARFLSKLEKAKSSDEAEEKFNIEEVNKKNKEHHDIPDSDMKEAKEEISEKDNLRSEGMNNLNSSDVTGFADQVSPLDERPSSETSASALPISTLEGQDEDKSSAQILTTEEKPSSTIEDKVRSQTSREKHPVKQTLYAETKTIKHVHEAELEAKMVKEVKKQSTDKQSSSKKTSALQQKKKMTEAQEDSTELISGHEKAALANPLITKEANEFSNEQEKSFASAIEKIKAQEEKLKGKEIDNEIQETLSPTKKHGNSQKKPRENNLKQLKIYKHQILSEVNKIDDLISEYHKDGHSTKELSEAKIVLQNDLNLVKELEKNTKKKTLKTEKEKEKERLQTMPSSAYLSTTNEENKDDITHRGKSNLDSKSVAKSLEAERSEKQLEKVIPSYEYYFQKSGQKSTAKHTKKPSLEEIHKLLKAEIKSLKQKKNGKADSQLKNIRKLVQQHLKKLISTGDIDKSAFHSLAPEIRQLGELLKERIKSLKKKKTARKVKTLKASTLTQSLKSGNKKASELYDQSMDVQVSTNEIKGGKVKTDRKVHHLAVEPKIGILEPSLESVKGVDSSGKPELPGMNPGKESSKEHSVPSASNAVSSSAASSAASTDVHNDEHKGIPLNESVILSALGGKAQSIGGGSVDPQGVNIRTLLNTLNEKLGAVYQNAKSVNDMAQQISQQPPQPETPTAEPAKEHQQARPEAQQANHDTVYETAIPGISRGQTQRYVAQKPVTGVQVASANVPTPNAQFASVPVAVPNAPNVPAQEVRSDYPQQQNMEQPQPINPPQVIDATESQAASTSSNNAQQVMASATSNAIPSTQTSTVPEQEAQANETPSPQVESNQQAAPDNKENLPMVPDEPEFEEDNTEALASLEPINTLVETLEKDITEIWSYKDLYPNAEALGLDNEKVHNTYANLGSLSGLSLRRALNRALRGEDVGLGVVGGSISKGGPFSEKGLEYVLRSYFYAIEDYWNKVIRPVTGSSMIVRDVSLGGISTDYYSFCIRNHLPDDKLTNIVLWELSANDMRRYDDSLKPKPQPLEQFTRNILTYRAKPSLVFVNFFALFDWDPDLRANCRNFEDEGEDDVAKYYKITSLSWRNMVCPLLKSETSPIFTRNNLFAEDHFHPSILGHAQMSYIIIDYIRTEFLKNLVKMRPFFIGDAVEKLQIPRSIYMPRPMFKETFLWKPLCYTYMLVDNRLPNNTMPLHEENESDFKYTVVRGFKIRSDKIAGMETKLKDQFIRYKLQIPRHEDGGIQPFKQLGIMSFTDDRYAEVQFDSEHPSRLEAKKRFLEGTVIKTIAENIEPGEHTLTVRSGDVGFLICALVLG